MKDKIGIWTSLICLIHCLVLPLFVTVIPFLSGLSQPMEIFLIGVAFVIGLLSFIDNYIKHKYIRPLLIFIGGFIQISISHYLDVEWINITGLVSLIVAHWINYKEIQKRDGCHPHGCKH